MKNRLVALALTGLLAGSWNSLAAQTPRPTPPTPSPAPEATSAQGNSSSEPQPPPRPARPARPTVGIVGGAADPTTPDPSRPGGPFGVTQTMEQEAQRYAPIATGTSVLPDMQLRGLADDGKRPPLAAIEVDGGLYYVRQGESSTIVLRGGRAVTLKLDKLADSAAWVHLEGLTESVLIR